MKFITIVCTFDFVNIDTFYLIQFLVLFKEELITTQSITVVTFNQFANRCCEWQARFLWPKRPSLAKHSGRS